MDIRFEINKIESYSRALAEKLCNEFFSNQEAIKGEQIVKLTPIDQVNLFVVKNLFDKWREESAKLKSPYFNYESHDVKEALQNVLNRLSQNIYIRKEFFKPLLEKGIFDTLFLILKPEGFFSNEYFTKQELLLSEIKESEKYYKINKGILDQLVLRLERENKFVIKGSELFAYAEILLKETPFSSSEKDKYLEQFSAMLKLEQSSVPNPVSLVTEPNVTYKEERPTVISADPVLNEKHILNEKFGVDKLTVNDQLKQRQSTLAEKISKSKIENIRGAISLSQKFLFINALFKGASSEYEKALTEIDQCQNYDQALNLLNDNYASKYQWDFNQYEVKEFVEIVERKFS